MWSEPDHPGIPGAVADNFVEHAAWTARATPGMTAAEDDDLVVIDSGLPCDTFNVICRARLEGKRAVERVRAALSHFRDARRPFSWWVGPSDRPETLGTLLVAEGLERADSELAMAANLSRIARPAPLPGLTIARVETPAQLETYARLISELWDPPDTEVTAFYRQAAPRLLATPRCPIRCYLAYLDHRPAGTAEATEASGVVGLYNISTAARFRGRGIGTWLTVYPLLQARERGARVGVLQAEAPGVGVYERVGFHTFGTFTEYKPPESWYL